MSLLNLPAVHKVRVKIAQNNVVSVHFMKSHTQVVHEKTTSEKEYFFEEVPSQLWCENNSVTNGKEI